MAGNGSGDRRSRSWVTWVIAVVAGLALVGGVVWFVLSQGGVTPAPPGPAPGPPRVPFAFAQPTLNVTSYTGGTSKEAAREVAEEVRTELSTLYDRGFVDPTTWTNGLPPEMWRLFDSEAGRRAQQDPASFGLGGIEGLEELEVIDATLTVEVLEDTARRPMAATATVRFRATGTRSDGSGLEVRNKATFLLRPMNGRWVIVGFPSLETKLDSVPPPAPAAGPSAGPTPSPSPTGDSG